MYFAHLAQKENLLTEVSGSDYSFFSIVTQEAVSKRRILPH